MPGIFTGKKERYNKLILQSLFYSKKTTQHIAEFIYDNNPDREGTRHQIKHIRSVIERPHSRLEELTTLEYIERDEDREWELTIKGLAVAASLVPVKDLTKNPYFGNMEELLSSPEVTEVLRRSVRAKESDIKRLMDIIRTLFPEVLPSSRMMVWLRDYAVKLQEQGHNIDKIPAEEFAHMFIMDANKMIRSLDLPKWKTILEGKPCPQCGRRIAEKNYKYCPYCAVQLS